MTHGITLTGYCARWASGLVVEPLGTWDSTGQEQLTIESASDEWQGVITATFWGPGAQAGTDMLMTDGACIVPPEALSAPGNGTITLRCTNAQGRRISVDLAYHSAGHAQVPGSPSEPTPDLWQQYVEQVAADADRAEQASKDAAGSAEAAAESAKQAAQATADIGEAKDDALEAIQQAQDTGVQAVQTATTTGVQAIQQAHQAALEAIGQVEQAAIGQVQQAGTTQVSAVQQAGQAQQTAIEQAGQSWQQQITAAGTAELGRWAPAIWDTAPLAAEHDIYAAEGAPLRVTQHGETQQQTTTGAQLANLPDVDVTGVSGISYKSSGNVVTVDGTATTQISSAETRVGSSQTLTLPTGSYTLSYTSSDASKPIRPYIKVDRPGGTERVLGNDSFNVDGTETAMMLFVQLEAGTYSKTTISVMLNAGSTALSWEPYTGGAPSPSPDYPQAIAGTGLNGKIVLDGTQNLTGEIGTAGWGGVDTLGTYLYTQDFAELPKISSPGCFSERFPARNSLYDVDYEGIFVNAADLANYWSVRVKKATLQKYGQIDTADHVKSAWAAYFAANPLAIYYHAAIGTDYTVGISTEDDAGGYHGQALAIGSPLYGDGNVADTVANDVLVDGEHKTVVTRRWRMVELDGTEAVGNYWNDSRDEQLANSRATFVISGMSALLPGVGSCTHFKVDTRVTQGLGAVVGFMPAAGTRLYFCVDFTTIGATAQDTDQQFVQKFAAWLAAQAAAGTPVRVLYQLATPEEYASDPHTLPALGSLPETVKATGQSTVSYSADTKHYIDNKLQAIAAQQLNFMIGGST